MKIIRTVTGDINPKDLGWCQCHEHVFIANGPSRKINSALFIDDYEKSLAEITSYKNAGGVSFVDAQPFGCGRIIDKLYKTSYESGVNIISYTGFHKTEFFENPDLLARQSEQSLTDIFVNEITNGINVGGDINAKAGVIKCAAVSGQQNADALYDKLFCAAVNTAKETNAPVLIHMDPGADALDIIRLFDDNGIAPSRLMFCHLDRTKYDFGYHEELAVIGVYLDYDTIQRLKYHDNEKELELIQHMAERGYADNIVLSLDTTSGRLKSYGADFGLDYILTEFGGKVAKRLGQNVLDNFMVKNPADFLSFNI